MSIIAPQIDPSFRTLADNLEVAFNDAKGKRVVDSKSPTGIATESFKNFFENSMDCKKHVNVDGHPLICGYELHVYDGINMMHDSIEGCKSPSYIEMSIKVNSYLTGELGISNEEFYEKHHSFAGDCFSVARNVLLLPSVRMPFGERAESYQGLIEYFRK